MTGNNWGTVTLACTPELMNWRLISSAHRINEVTGIGKETDLAYFYITVWSGFM
jgi:hypothetical protein